MTKAKKTTKKKTARVSKAKQAAKDKDNWRQRNPVAGLPGGGKSAPRGLSHP